MENRRNMRVACGAAVAGLVVLVGAGYALKDRVIEEWHIRTLLSDDFAAKFDAARSLGEIRSARAIPELIDLLRESPDHAEEAREVWGPAAHPAREVAGVLREIGPAAVPSLANALRETDGTRGYWRRSACGILGEIGTEAALAPLIARLEDGDGCVAMIAANGLGSLGPRAASAIPALSAALDDDKAFIRTAAARALRAIRGNGTVAKKALQRSSARLESTSR